MPDKETDSEFENRVWHEIAQGIARVSRTRRDREMAALALRENREPVSNNPEINKKFVIRERRGWIVDTYVDGTRLVQWTDGSIGHLSKEFFDDWCMFEDGR